MTEAATQLCLAGHFFWRAEAAGQKESEQCFCSPDSLHLPWLQYVSAMRGVVVEGYLDILGGGGKGLVGVQIRLVLWGAEAQSGAVV